MVNSVKKVAIVTGASEGGMGWEFALALKRHGYKTYGTVRSEAKSAPLKAHSILPLIMDVTNLDSIKNALSEFQKTSERLDLLINNAGGGYVCSLLEGDLEKGKALFDANFWGQLHVVQVFAPLMCQQRAGLIANVGSVAGIRAFPWIGLYSASKAALHSYTDCLRQELKPFGVKAVCVSPGLVATQFEGSEQIDKTPSKYYANVEDGFKASLTTRDMKHGMPRIEFADYIITQLLKEEPKELIIQGAGAFNFKWIFPYIPIWVLDKLTFGDVSTVRAKELA